MLYGALHVWALPVQQLVCCFIIHQQRYAKTDVSGSAASSKPFVLLMIWVKVFLIIFIWISFLGAPVFPFPSLSLSLCFTFAHPFNFALFSRAPFCSTNLSTVFNLLLPPWFHFWDGEISAKVRLRWFFIRIILFAAVSTHFLPFRFRRANGNGVAALQKDV